MASHHERTAPTPMADRPIRVLLLEDSPLDAELIAERLDHDRLRCDVTRVDSAESFRAQLEHDVFDIVLSDFSLPGYDGFSALELAIGLRPHVPFIFVSGALGEELAIDTMRRGATDYVLKHRLQRLVPAMRRALREADERAQRRLAEAELARLLIAEREARHDAERTAARLARLQSAAAALTRASAPRDVAVVLVEQACAALGVTSGRCWGLDEDDQALVPLAGRGSAFGDGRPDRIGLDEDTPVAQAARNRAPLWLADDDGPSSRACVPLQIERRTIGVLELAISRHRPVGADERAMLAALIAHGSQALDRARVYALEQQARQRMTLLAEVGEAFGASMDYETTLQNVASLTLPMLGDFGFFDVVEPEGGVRRIARAYANERVQSLLDATAWSPSTSRLNVCALTSGRAGMHPVIDEQWLDEVAQSPEHKAALQTLGIHSLVTVPLRNRGRTLGGLTLCFAESGRRHTANDLHLAEEVARRAAAAVDNARLLTIAQRERARVEEASRAKEEFLAAVSHELRSPLNAIAGWAALLRTGTLPPDKQARALETIERNTRTQAQLIEDLLDISRIVTGKLRLELRTVDLRALVEASIEALRPTAEAQRVGIVTHMGTDPIELSGDPHRLEQIVTNLLTNGIKFTPPDGRVDVRLRNHGTTVELVVEDTGRGIAREFLPHVFERFRQADAAINRAHGGLGLGLAIAHHLVELHGGAIRADSDGEGRGARFTVRLPVQPSVPRSSDPIESGSTESGARLQGIRLLIVDDEADARELLVALLSAEGAVARGVSTAAAAFEVLRRTRPDVLVSDIGMPHETGYDLIRRVRALPAEEGGATPAIALTAFARAEDRSRTLAAGFDAHLTKPVDREQLVDAVLAHRKAAGQPALGGGSTPSTV